MLLPDLVDAADDGERVSREFVNEKERPRSLTWPGVVFGTENESREVA